VLLILKLLIGLIIQNIYYKRFEIESEKNGKILKKILMGKVIQLEYIGKYKNQININNYNDEQIYDLIKKIKISKYYNEIFHSKLIENKNDNDIKNYIDVTFRGKKMKNQSVHEENNENIFGFAEIPIYRQKNYNFDQNNSNNKKNNNESNYIFNENQ